MTRLHHVKKAWKDNTAVKAGEPYYWWQFAYGRKQYSRTIPKRSQLTQSAFLGGVFDIEDDIGELGADDGLVDAIATVVESIRELGEMSQESLDNMPEQLKDAPSGEVLQERSEGLESWIDEMGGVDFSGPDLSEVEENERDTFAGEYWQAVVDEIQGMDPGLA